MLIKNMKDLFEKGEYQKLLDQLTRKEVEEDFATLSADELIQCFFYKSRSLECLGRFEESLQVATSTRMNQINPSDQSLILGLIVAQLVALLRLGRLDEALTIIKEGNDFLDTLSANNCPVDAFWLSLFERTKGSIFWGKGELDISLAQYQRSLSLSKTIEDSNGIISSLANIGLIYWHKGKLDTALDYFQRSLILSETINNPKVVAQTLNNIGLIYRDKGELDTALDYHQRSLILAKIYGNPKDIAMALNNIGIIFSDKGELDTALDYYQQALALRETIGNPRDIAMSLNNIGLCYNAKEDWNKALEYYQRSLALSETVGESGEISLHLRNIGSIFHAKGELDTALRYYQRCLILRETIGNPLLIGYTLQDIGRIYHAKGELNVALDYYQRSKTLYEAICNDLDIFLVLFDLLRLTIDCQNQDQAQKHLIQMQQLSHRIQNTTWVASYVQLAEALVLKQSNRMKHKIQAQTLLEQTLNNKPPYFNLTALAMINLCDLFLLEVKSTGDLDILEEAKKLIQELHIKAHNQPSHVIMIDTLLLKAKFASIEGKLQEVQEYYHQAISIATEKNLGVMLTKACEEQESFEAEFEKWHTLIQSNASLKERIEQTKIEEYITKAVKVIHSLHSSNGI